MFYSLVNSGGDYSNQNILARISLHQRGKEASLQWWRAIISPPEAEAICFLI